MYFAYNILLFIGKSSYFYCNLLCAMSGVLLAMYVALDDLNI
jgi:hypothetical protein